MEPDNGQIKFKQNLNSENRSYPVHGAEVDRFSKVETLVEPTVVSSGEGDDKLTCTLVSAIDLPLTNKQTNKHVLDVSVL